MDKEYKGDFKLYGNVIKNDFDTSIIKVRTKM